MTELKHSSILSVQAKNHSAPATRAQQHRTQPATVNHGYGLKGIYTEGHLWTINQLIYYNDYIAWKI